MRSDALILSLLAGAALCVAILASLAALLGLIFSVLSGPDDPYASGFLFAGLLFAPPFAGLWWLCLALVNRLNATGGRRARG